jgi:hypothetical protein
MSKGWNVGTTIKVALEYTKANNSIDKTAVISTGITATTKFAQVENGIAYYNSTKQLFSYNATFQQALSTEATGDLLEGPLFEFYGNYYPGSDKYSIEFKKVH